MSLIKFWLAQSLWIKIGVGLGATAILGGAGLIGTRIYKNAQTGQSASQSYPAPSLPTLPSEEPTPDLLGPSPTPTASAPQPTQTKKAKKTASSGATSDASPTVTASIPEGPSDSPSAGASPSSSPTSDPAPVLKNISINIDDYNPAAGRAGDFVFHTDFLKVFWEVGYITSGMGSSYSGTWDFSTVPTAQVMSAIDGIVENITYQATNDDYEIWIVPRSGSRWRVNHDHVQNPQVAVGNTVSAGQIIGVVMTYGDLRYGRVELQVDYQVSERATWHYCPVKYFDSGVASDLRAKITELMSDWETFKGDATLYKQEQQLYPACEYEYVIEDETGGHPPS